MTRQLPYRTDISSRIQQIADKGAPEITRGEHRYLGLLSSLPEDV
jgi:hypothetical protein